MKATITAISHYLPDKIITNADLASKFAMEEKSIFKRTGIKERRYADTDTTSAFIIAEAVKKILTTSGKNHSEIDCLIVGTLTPDYFFPSTAVAVINKLELRRAWGFDISAACSGFCYGLSLAKAMIEQGNIKNAIVCGAERMSRTLNGFDYKTGILFGDGCGAALIERTDSLENTIIDTLCKVEADDLNDVYFKTPFSSLDWVNEKFELAGTKVYKHGVQLTIDLIHEYLKKSKTTLEDFTYIVPHQANTRMLREVAEGLKVPIEKFLINIELVGNTGGASIPICLSEMYLDKKIKKGDRLLLCSFGSGYTVSVVDLKWSF